MSNFVLILFLYCIDDEDGRLAFDYCHGCNLWRIVPIRKIDMDDESKGARIQTPVRRPRNKEVALDR